MHDVTRFIRWFAVLLLGGVLALPAQAQRYIVGPATGLDDAKSLLANPALVSFHRSKVALGAKAHYLGLSNNGGAPLRQGFVTASTPFLFRDRLGLGGQIQYFDSPIFSRSALGVSASGRILRFLSVGVRVSALNLSYNESEFVGVEPGDPVFEAGLGKTTFTSAVGLFAKPLPNLNLSVGVRGLNKPDLSLVGAGVPAHRTWFGGAAYGWKAFRLRAEVATGRYGLESLVALEAYSTDGSYLRLGSNPQFTAGEVEAQLHVGGPLSINYNYGLPLSDIRTTTSGSHQFSIVYEFGRTPDLPDPPPPPPLMLAADAPAVQPEFAPKLYLTADDEYLQHFEKRIERDIRVPDAALRSLSRDDLGVLDSSFAAQRGRVPSDPVPRIPENLRMADLLSSTYDSSLTALEAELAQDSARSVAVKGRGPEQVKAIGLRNRLVRQGRVRPDQVRVMTPTAGADSVRARRRPVDPRMVQPLEQLSILNPESTTLYLLHPYLGQDAAQGNGSWELEVEDSAGAIVRSFTGLGPPPPTLTWDWSDDSGEPLDHGVYRYRLTWTGPDGEQLQSNERTLYVRQVVRKVTIEVTQDPTVLEQPADDMEIRFQNN
jgi:hypothetical protein